MTTLVPADRLRLAEHAVIENCGLKLSPEFVDVLDAEPRELLVTGGWRAGKSSSGAGKVQKRLWRWNLEYNVLPNALRADYKRLVWLVGPDYEQTKSEYGYLRAWNTRLGNVLFASDAKEGSLSMILKGNIEIVTKSAAHPERLGSVAPDYILLCEAGQCSEETRFMMLGRAAEKRANICYTGTLENEEGKETYAWYQENAEEWALTPDGEHQSVSLPSWSNLVVFPGGREDEEILRLEREYLKATRSSYLFDRKLGGKPNGVQYAVYEQLEQADVYHKLHPDEPHSLIAAFPEDARLIGNAGGIDYGDFHPSSITVCHLVADPRDGQPGTAGWPRGILWVRENWFNDLDPGDTSMLQSAKKDLTKRWGIRNWATDPNERYMARDFGIETVSGSQGARGHRMGLMRARLNLGKVMYDINGHGVAALYEEQKKVRFRKNRAGKMELVRALDDRTASFEDANEIVDGTPKIHMPKKIPTTHTRSPQRRKEFRRVG